MQGTGRSKTTSSIILATRETTNIIRTRHARQPKPIEKARASVYAMRLLWMTYLTWAVMKTMREVRAARTGWGGII